MLEHNPTLGLNALQFTKHTFTILTCLLIALSFITSTPHIVYAGINNWESPGIKTLGSYKIGKTQPSAPGL